MVESKQDKTRVKVFLKNGIVFEGTFVSKDERFIQLINYKDGKLKIVNLDRISDMEMDKECKKI